MGILQRISKNKIPTFILLISILFSVILIAFLTPYIQSEMASEGVTPHKEITRSVNLVEIDELRENDEAYSKEELGEKAIEALESNGNIDNLPEEVEEGDIYFDGEQNYRIEYQTDSNIVGISEPTNSWKSHVLDKEKIHKVGFLVQESSVSNLNLSILMTVIFTATLMSIINLTFTVYAVGSIVIMGMKWPYQGFDGLIYTIFMTFIVNLCAAAILLP